MPVVLNNVATSDNYTDTATCVFARATTKVSIIIANAAVYIRYEKALQGRRSGQFSMELFQVPGTGSKIDPFGDGSPIISVAFRSAASGVPASVTATPA